MSSTGSGAENNVAAERRPSINNLGNDFSTRTQHEPVQTHARTREQAQIDTQVQAVTQRPPDQESCRCTQRIVFLINELETSLSFENDGEDNDGNGVGVCSPLPLSVVNDLDSALGLHKEAVRYGELMQQCQQCSARAENRVFLLLLANRLAIRCTHMVAAYCRHASAQQTTPPCYHYGGNANMPPPIAITVGEYEVDSAAEAEVVLRVLIGFQLRALHSFASSLAGPHQPQSAEFVVVKNKATTLLRRLQQSSVSLSAKPVVPSVR